MPQPPSAASVRITQVLTGRWSATTAASTRPVASAVICRWPSRLRAAGGVTICTRTAAADIVLPVATAPPGRRWTKAAVLSRWNAPGAATPSARSTAQVRSVASWASAPSGRRSVGTYTSIIGMARTPPTSHLGEPVGRRVAACRFGRGRDEPYDVVRVGDHRKVARVDLDRRGSHALSELSLGVRRDGPVTRCHHVPGRERLPRGRAHLVVERTHRDRLL